MKTYKEFILTEISTRLKHKFVKLAEPQAKGLGLVGTLTDNPEKVKKANATLDRIRKTKEQLDNMDVKQGSTQQ